MRGRLQLGALLPALAVLLLVAVAPAESAAKVSVKDRKGDSPYFNGRQNCPLDIRRASVRRISNGRIKQTIKTQCKLTGLTSRWAPAMLGFDIRAGGSKYDVVSHYRGRGGTVYRRTGRFDWVEVGEARVRLRGRKITFVFGSSAIGSPESYRWRAQSNSAEEGGDGGCTFKRCPPYSDRAPGKGFKSSMPKKPQLPTEKFKVNNGRTEFTAVCPSTSTAPCKGEITIKATVKRRHLGGGKGSRRINVIKRHSYSAPIGGTDKVKLKLTKPAKQYFKRKRSLIGSGLLKAGNGKKTRFRAVLKR